MHPAYSATHAALSRSAASGLTSANAVAVDRARPAAPVASLAALTSLLGRDGDPCSDAAMITTSSPLLTEAALLLCQLEASLALLFQVGEAEERGAGACQ